VKKLIPIFSIILASEVVSVAQHRLPLTNDVPIVDYGMRLALCDNFFERDNSLPLSDVSDLHAEKELVWILHNPTTNIISVIYIGDSNSFDLKMFNTNGVEIQKTAKGKAMSMGPKSFTSIEGNPTGQRLGGEHLLGATRH
jgi:hypothetical protein